jgi:O-antigen/teichoic acid export membrane protein
MAVRSRGTLASRSPGPVPGASHDPLRSLVRRAAAWSTLDVAVNRTGSFLLGIVVARLLAPHDFGVYAVALVVHTIVISISDLGLGTALVRDDDEAVPAAAPTIATIAIANSLALGALMALSAPILARLLAAPQATSTIQVMALTLPLAGLAAVPGALLRREFRMDRMFIADTANTVASAVIVVPLAIAGWGPLALAFSFVAGQALTTVMVTIYSPRRYRPGWNPQQARYLLRFGMPLVGASILAFSIQNVDYIVVGRVLGPVALGLYVLAFNISSWPQTVFSSVIRSVSLPAFSRMREGGRDMAEQFASALRMVSRLTFPVCLFLGALAPHLVVTVYGGKWAAASTALIGLSIFAAGRTMTELFADFLVSLGRTRAVLLVQVIWLPTLTAALLVLVERFGIAGAGAAQAAVAVLIVVPAYVFLVSRSDVRPAMVARALLPSLSLASVTALVAWTVSSRVGTPFLACAAGGGAGLALYVVPHLSELRQTLARERIRRRSESTALIESAA